MTRILAIAAALGLLGCIGLGLALRSSWRAEAAAQTQLASAVEANASLVTERDRYKRAAAAESDRAQQRQRERGAMSARVADLRQRLGDLPDECRLSVQQLEEIDRFFER